MDSLGDIMMSKEKLLILKNIYQVFSNLNFKWMNIMSVWQYEPCSIDDPQISQGLLNLIHHNLAS
jgi:hypothetical protein